MCLLGVVFGSIELGQPVGRALGRRRQLLLQLSALQGSREVDKTVAREASDSRKGVGGGQDSRKGSVRQW